MLDDYPQERCLGYTEIPLECMRNGVNYNLIQDIFVGNPGFDFAQSLGIK